MIVYKFGGTSVADGERIRAVARLVGGADETPVVVVSALGGVTDELAELAERRGDGAAERCREILDELVLRHRAVARHLAGGGTGSSGAGPGGDGGPGDLPVDAPLERLGRALDEGPAEDEDPRQPYGSPFRDRICAAGEDLSAALVAQALRLEGLEAETVDAREIVRTDDGYGRAVPDAEEVRRLADRVIRPLVESGTVPVLQGFVGATADGVTTTLGRGGSDFTAALLGAALEAREISIWTDVDGVLSADPRAVDSVRVLPEIGFEEAVELAYFGARVIHPAAAKHAVSRGVPIRIRNTFRPDAPGTLIRSDRRGMPQVAAVAYKPDVVLIEVRAHPSALPYGFLARVFRVLADHELPVDLVATSHSSTAFTIDENQELDEVRRELSDFADVEVTRGLATVTVVGTGLLDEPGMDALIFWAVEKTPIHLISQASNVSLSFLVSELDAHDVVRRLHRSLIEFPERARAFQKEEAAV